MLNELANDSMDRRVVAGVTPNSANTPFDTVEHTATHSCKNIFWNKRKHKNVFLYFNKTLENAEYEPRAAGFRPAS